MKEQFEIGAEICFLYPRHNFFSVVSKLENRKLRINEIRDVTESPLKEITFEIQPLLRRSLILVTGIDLDKGEERSFYAASMQEISPFQSVESVGQ